MYVTDNLSWLPFCNWDGGTAPGQGWLYGPGAPTKVTTGTITSPYTAPNSDWKSGSLWGSIQQKNTYFCPKDIKSQYYSQRVNQLSSYVWDGATAGFDSANAYQTCKTTQVWSPLCFLFWEPDDTLGGAFEFNDGANFPTTPPAGTEGIGLLHNKTGGMITRIDGGVQFITSTNFAKDGGTPAGQGPGPGGKTFLWWSTYSDNGH